jgi:hypothetical protein
MEITASTTNGTSTPSVKEERREEKAKVYSKEIAISANNGVTQPNSAPKGKAEEMENLENPMAKEDFRDHATAVENGGHSIRFCPENPGKGGKSKGKGKLNYVSELEPEGEIRR